MKWDIRKTIGLNGECLPYGKAGKDRPPSTAAFSAEVNIKSQLLQAQNIVQASPSSPPLRSLIAMAPLTTMTRDDTLSPPGLNPFAFSCRRTSPDDSPRPVQ
jgi:hypothetical protein